MKLFHIEKFKPFYLISGGIVVLATILFYFLLLDLNTPIFWLSLFFLLLAETVLFLVAAYGNMSILRAALISVSGFHLLLTIALSFLYLQSSAFSIKSFVLWNILLLAAVYLIDAYLIYNFRKIREKDEPVRRAQSVMGRYAAMAQTLVDRHAGSPFFPQLKKIQEDLRFSDNTVLTGDEDRIGELLEQLQRMLDNQEEDRVQPHIELIRQAINQRTQQIKQIKTGKF